MKNIFTLYKVLTKNAEMRLPKGGTKGTIYMALGIIAASCIMIPCCLIVGFISYVMTLALVEANAPLNGLLAEIHIMSAFSCVFGVLVIFNILFFSSDREHMVPLPFKSYELLAGKFLFSYMAESVMEFMILLSMFIGFFFAIKPTIIGCLAAIVGVALIPLLPLLYCAIISLLVFSLIKRIHNTKILNHISTLVMLLFTGLFLYSFRGVGEITVENYINTLADGSNLFSNILSKIFFTVPFLLDAIENNSIISLIIYILLNIGMFGVMMLLGHFLYQPCLYAVGALGENSKKKIATVKATRERSPFIAYIIKEYKVILRTRAYSGNCFYINYLWPAGLALYLYLNWNKEIFRRFYELYQSGTDNAYVIISLLFVALSFVACAMNSVASTSFTREGAHLSLVKYIPVSYKTQMYAKEFISLSITFPPLLLFLIIFGIAFNISPMWYIYYALLILFCIVITTVIGIMLDSAAPHSDWDDEYSALRGNLNTFFDMAIMMVLSVIIAGISFILYTFTPIGINGFHIILFTIPAILALFMITAGNKRVLTNMDEM